MEPHELALAALQEVAQSTVSSHRRDPNPTGKVEALGSHNATGINLSNDTTTLALDSSSPSFGKEDIMSQMTQGQDDSNTDTSVIPTSSNNSQSTSIGHDTASTPPTSASDEFSSQNTSQDEQHSQLSQLSQLAAAQIPIGSPLRPAVSITSTAGQKRTADGQVKSGPSFSPNSPRVRGHSRNTSAVSNASSSVSRIGEVDCR